MTRTPQETELDRLLDLIADHIDPERRRQIDERYLRALYWEEVDRPPLVVREATDSTFKLPSPWDGFRRYPYSEAFDSPAAMLQNELIENVVPSLVLGDDGPLAVRNNHGTIQAASALGGRVEIRGNDYPWVKAVDSRDILKDIAATRGEPDLQAGMLPRSFETLTFYREKLNEHPPLSDAVQISLPDLQGPMDTAEQLWGSSIFYAFHDDEELLGQLLSTVVETTLAVYDRFRELATDRLDPRANAQHGYMIPGRLLIRNDSSIMLSPEMYERSVLPHDARLLHEVGKGAIHFCGNGQHLVDRMLKIPDLLGIDPGQPYLMQIEDIYTRCRERRVAVTNLMCRRDALVDGKAIEDFPTGCVLVYEAGDFDDARDVVTQYQSLV